MAGIRIPNLPTATSPNSSDVFPIVNNNLTKQVSFFNAATSLGVISAPSITTTFGALSTVTQTVSASVSPYGVTFSFNKFNPALGTLNSVTFAILSSIDSNYFSVTNNRSTSLSVKNPQDYLIVSDNQGNGADYTGINVPLVTTPATGTVGYTLAGNSSQNFTVTPKSLIGLNAVITDLSPYSNRYTGTGNVTFNVNNGPNATISGSPSSLNMSTVTNTTTLQLTYTYYPITINISPFSSYIIVPVTDNTSSNGTNLLSAYTGTFTPNASALSSTNRAVLILPPATYNLGPSSLKLNREYIDIVGLTKDASHVTITSSNSAATIQQTANDVRCIGFTVNNSIITSPGSSSTGEIIYPAGWAPANNLNLTYWENVTFSSIKASNISGYFKNCKSTNTAYVGGGFVGSEIGSSVISGTFDTCTGINDITPVRFSTPGQLGGGFFSGYGTIASGKFINCTGTNFADFGGGFGGFGCIVTGTFINCTGTSNNGSYSGGFFGGTTEIRDTSQLVNCRGTCNGGDRGGGFAGQGCTNYGTFMNCIGINSSTNGGGFIGQESTPFGTFINCTGTNSGVNGAGFFGQTGFFGMLIGCIGSSNNGYGFKSGLVPYENSGMVINCTFSDTTLPSLTNSGDSTKPACYINCLDGSGRLVNGSA